MSAITPVCTASHNVEPVYRIRNFSQLLRTSFVSLLLSARHVTAEWGHLSFSASYLKYFLASLSFCGVDRAADIGLNEMYM